MCTEWEKIAYFLINWNYNSPKTIRNALQPGDIPCRRQSRIPAVNQSGPPCSRRTSIIFFACCNFTLTVEYTIFFKVTETHSGTQLAIQCYIQGKFRILFCFSVSVTCCCWSVSVSSHACTVHYIFRQNMPRHLLGLGRLCSHFYPLFYSFIPINFTYYSFQRTHYSQLC